MPAGEQAGILGQLLTRLAAYLEKAHAVRRRIQSALAYPALVLAVAVAATTFLLVVIVPTFADMYRDYGADLPAPTRLLLHVSTALTTHFWIFVAGGLGAFFGLRTAVRKPSIRAALDRLTPMIVQMIAVGEESGELDDMLLHVVSSRSLSPSSF